MSPFGVMTVAPSSPRKPPGPRGTYGAGSSSGAGSGPSPALNWRIVSFWSMTHGGTTFRPGMFTVVAIPVSIRPGTGLIGWG